MQAKKADHRSRGMFFYDPSAIHSSFWKQPARWKRAGRSDFLVKRPLPGQSSSKEEALCRPFACTQSRKRRTRERC